MPDNERPFKSNQIYTEDEIITKATPVNHFDEYLVADTPSTEYWFIREGHYWKLSHTWGHFLLVKKVQGCQKELEGK
jgi:hypothetical protein